MDIFVSYNVTAIPITTNVDSGLKVRIDKALEDKVIDSQTYKKYLRRKYGNTSLNFP